MADDTRPSNKSDQPGEATTTNAPGSPETQINTNPTPGGDGSGSVQSDLSSVAPTDDAAPVNVTTITGPDGSVMRLQMVPVAGTAGTIADFTKSPVPGGKYKRADGMLVNANNEPIQEDGTVKK